MTINRREILTRLTLIILSIGTTLYLVEIALFLATPYIETPKGIRVSKPELFQVVQGYRDRGFDTYPIVFPRWHLRRSATSNGDRFFPLAGVSNKHTLFCNETGEWVVYQSDEYGFNNPAGLYETQELDILILGDSFAHGWCVEPDENVAGHLRQDDRKVLNLAYAATGPLIELATLREYGEPYQPKVVLWMYFEGNDLYDLSQEQESLLLQKYLESDFRQGLREQQPDVDNLLINDLQVLENEVQTENLVVEDAVSQTSLVRVAKLQKVRSLLNGFIVTHNGPTSDQAIGTMLPLLRQILTITDAKVDGWDGQLYFVYLPAWERYQYPSKQTYQREQVLTLVAELDIPIIDFQDVLSAQPDPLSFFPFRAQGHYTAEGYSLLAQQIETYLASK